MKKKRVFLFFGSRHFSYTSKLWALPRHNVMSFQGRQTNIFDRLIMRKSPSRQQQLCVKRKMEGNQKKNNEKNELINAQGQKQRMKQVDLQL